MGSIKRKLILVLLISSIMGSLVFYTSAKAMAVVNVKAPDFTITMLNGSKVNLSSFRNEIVVLIFGRPLWCANTQFVINMTNSLADSLNKDKVKFIVLDIDPFNSQIVNYTNQNGLKNLSFSSDNIGNSIMWKYLGLCGVSNSITLPATFVIDKGGIIRFNSVGIVTNSDLQKTLISLGGEEILYSDKAIGSLDTPKAGQAVSGTCAVKGWFLDSAGVSKIEVLVDGTVKGTAAYGQARTDVGALFPDYKNSNCGYSYNLDTTKLTNGSHSIVIRETGNNGKTTSLAARSVTVANALPVKGSLDTPKDGQSISGISTVKGWFLDGRGVSKIEVLVDGTVRGEAAYGQARTDVGALFPDYKNNNCGYTYSLDTTKLINGSHSIVIRETSGNGAQTSLSARAVTVSNVLPSKGALDTPKAGQTISGTAVVKGWFLDGSGVTKIEVLVDGTVKGTAVYGSARTDIGTVFPDYKNTNCGFSYSLDTTKLTNGSHSIVIRETGKNGKTTSLAARSVTAANVLAAKGALDTPKAGQTVSGICPIKGWFLDGSGVAKIEILVDGAVKGAAAYGLMRTDIGTVFPEYKNTNCGYSCIMDTTKLINGSHSIVIRETGVNGAKTSLAARSVTVAN